MAFLAKQRAKMKYNTGLGILSRLSSQKDLQKALGLF